MSGRVAIYPGSFDPLTEGHLGIIRQAARLFDRLVVVVGYNPNKRSLFSVEERLRFIQAATAALGNVAADSFTGELLVSYARRNGATIVVRGLRNSSDYRNEWMQSSMNQRMMPELETVFFVSDPKDNFVSSTLVRQLIQSGGDFAPYVPDAVRRLIGYVGIGYWVFGIGRLQVADTVPFGYYRLWLGHRARGRALRHGFEGWVTLFDPSVTRPIVSLHCP